MPLPILNCATLSSDWGYIRTVHSRAEGDFRFALLSYIYRETRMTVTKYSSKAEKRLGKLELKALFSVFSNFPKWGKIGIRAIFSSETPRGSVFSPFRVQMLSARRPFFPPPLLIPRQIERRRKKHNPLAVLGGGSLNPDQAKARRRRRGFREIEKFPPKKNGYSHPFLPPPTQRAFLLRSDIY